MKKVAFFPAAAVAAGLSNIHHHGSGSGGHEEEQNLWRNLAIGAGVVAGHGLITHNGTGNFARGGGRGLFSQPLTEQDRHHQSQANAAWSQVLP